jgi:FkbM family methyltransferase
MARQIWKILKSVNRTPEILRCTRETAQWAEISAAYTGLARLPYPHMLRLRGGERIRLEELQDLKAFWQIFLRKVYRVRATDRVILDLGANIGLFTLYAARRAPQARVVALEPFPSTFRRLLETVHDHHLDDRVTCLNIAVTGASGVRIMPTTPIPSQSRFLAPADSGRSGTEVVGKTLETVLDENDLDRVDLLKIDIEGSEYEVLLSTPPSALARISRIAMEYHADGGPYSKQQLFEHLRGAGFTVAWDMWDAKGYGVTEMVFRS